jgi:hypothetical protein
VLFRGRHGYFWLGLLFCLSWCLFVLAHLCFLIVQEFQDSLFVDPFVAILDSNVFSRGLGPFFRNRSTEFLELGDARDFGRFIGIGVEWDFEVVGVGLLHVWISKNYKNTFSDLGYCTIKRAIMFNIPN